ncbi:MAG TPA: ribonuclease P protein component [Bryobacteraceae bacterium]
MRASDYRLVYDKGFRVASSLFAAFCLARQDVENGIGPRIGLTVPRAVAGAVGRNRIKRRLREAFRLHRSDIGPQWDIVFNPRRPVLQAQFKEIERELESVIRKCNLR